MQLFQLFSFSDQNHSVRVLQMLADAGHVDGALQKAALLHDVGKTRLPLSWLDRCVVVVLKTVFPKRWAGWGQHAVEPYGWRKACVVKWWHPEWGAEMAQQAGCPELTVRLIRHHQDPLDTLAETSERELLRLLQWADDLS